MKKVLWVLMSLVLATAARAGFPVSSGTFAGTGQWKGPGGSSGEYSVETSVKDQVLTSSYKYRQGNEARSESVTFRMASGEPFFDLLDEHDKVVGSGYCYETDCSYRAEFSGIAVEETLRFGKGTLEKLGAKKGPGFSVVWKEVLAAK